MKISIKFGLASFAVISSLITATFVPAKVANAQKFAGCYSTPFYELYEHGDGGGAINQTKCSPPEASNLSINCIKAHPFTKRCNPSWNDRTSSIRTNGSPVSLYADSNFQGACIVVKTASGGSNFHSPKALNLSKVGFEDVVSSVRYGKDQRCRDLTNVKA